MPRAGNREALIAEFRRVWSDRKSDPSKLFQMLTPWFEHWEWMLKLPEYKKDINYVTLCRRLESRYHRPALSMIKDWVKSIEKTFQRNLINELQYIFLETLRGLQYYPTQASLIMTEYVIAKAFKDKLQSKIETTHEVDTTSIDHATITNSIVIDGTQPDYLLLKNLNLDSWESYLFQLKLTEHSTVSIANLSHIARRIIIDEEETLWNYLRGTWHAGPISAIKKRS